MAAHHIAYLEGQDCLVNLAGDYHYLSAGYYLSQDLENQGKNIHPTPREVMDAYIVPLFLEKARLAELPIPAYYITNDYFEPPVVVDAVNPFMMRQSIVRKEGSGKGSQVPYSQLHLRYLLSGTSRRGPGCRLPGGIGMECSSAVPQPSRFHLGSLPHSPGIGPGHNAQEWDTFTQCNTPSPTEPSE